jgi:hypothetical protein
MKDSSPKERLIRTIEQSSLKCCKMMAGMHELAPSQKCSTYIGRRMTN